MVPPAEPNVTVRVDMSVLVAVARYASVPPLKFSGAIVPVVEPRLALSLIFNTPALSVVGPVYVLALCSVTVPVPAICRPVDPAMPMVPLALLNVYGTPPPLLFLKVTSVGRTPVAWMLMLLLVTLPAPPSFASWKVTTLVPLSLKAAAALVCVLKQLIAVVSHTLLAAPVQVSGAMLLAMVRSISLPTCERMKTFPATAAGFVPMVMLVDELKLTAEPVKLKSLYVPSPMELLKLARLSTTLPVTGNVRSPVTATWSFVLPVDRKSTR